MKKAAAKDEKPLELNISSLMDILTILLLFLILSFGSQEQNVIPPKDFDLPDSTSELPVKLAVQVTVGPNDIMVEDNELRIQGCIEQEKIGTPMIEEYRVGNYSRTFTLSNLIDREKITATMKDGVLRVALHKAEAAKPKKIAIQTG